MSAKKKKKAPREITPEQWIEAARGLHALNTELEIDDDAEVSESDDGAFVQAWVWVPKDAFK